MRIYWLSIRSAKPYLTTWPSHPIIEALNFRIGHLSSYLPPSTWFILDTWIFHQFISIYHSKSRNCSQVYTVSLATSYYWIYWNIFLHFLIAFTLSHLRTWNNVQTDATRNSQTDWLAYSNLQIGWVAIRKFFGLQLTELQLADSQIVDPHFRITPY